MHLLECASHFIDVYLVNKSFFLEEITLIESSSVRLIDNDVISIVRHEGMRAWTVQDETSESDEMGDVSWATVDSEKIICRVHNKDQFYHAHLGNKGKYREIKVR